MLLGIVSANIKTITASPAAIHSSIIKMISTPGLPEHYFAMIFTLIIILTLKEIFSFSQKGNKYLNNSLNLALVPFIFTFIMIVLYKVLAAAG